MSVKASRKMLLKLTPGGNLGVFSFVRSITTETVTDFENFSYFTFFEITPFKKPDLTECFFVKNNFFKQTFTFVLFLSSIKAFKCTYAKQRSGF